MVSSSEYTYYTYLPNRKYHEDAIIQARYIKCITPVDS